MGYMDQPWTPEDIEQLTQLWGERMSAQKIGDIMGRTKCSIVGKAHRLHLEGRESPIRPKKTLGQIVREKIMRIKPKPRIRAKQVLLPFKDERIDLKAETLKREISADRVVILRSPIPTDVKLSKTRTCSWLEGEPIELNWCGGPARADSSYCPEHHSRCYIRHIPMQSRSA